MAIAALPAGVLAKAPGGSWGIDLANLSQTISPGDAFFDYVNEGWLRTAVSPPGYAEYGEINAMYLRTEAWTNAVVQSGRVGGTGVADPKLGALYASFMDTDAIERRATAPIRADIGAILTIPDHAGVARWMARPVSHAIVGNYVFPDETNTRRTLLHLDQQTLGSRILGLPSRVHYEDQGGEYPALRIAYRDHIVRMLELAGVADANTAQADAVVALEASLAAAMWTAEQLRDRRLNYHLMSRADLLAYAPGFDWNAYLEAAGFGDVEEIVLNTDTAIQASAAIFAETPVETWRTYLAFHWIQNLAYLLNAEIQETSFAFYGRRLARQETQRSREARGIGFVNRNLPDLIGKAYVAEHFSATHRDRIEAMAVLLKRAFAARIAHADWLDDVTRSVALSKIEKMGLKLGYPDTLRDYAEVDLRPDDAIGNLHSLNAAKAAQDRLQLDDRQHPWPWHLAPHAVDGSYSPQFNAVTFPAGILQAPAFSLTADAAVNFGAIGAVLGHEMAHGFDDQGSRFDDEGNMRDWWSPDSRAAFEARAERLVAQYDGYEPLPGVNLGGQRSLGENLADLVGVTLALDAFRLHAGETGMDMNAHFDGFTAEQRFFLGWAQFWRTLTTEEALRRQSQSAYHSPARYRVNGVVRNIDAWYEAFDVGPDAALYLAPDERVAIW
ncbi:M13 family metallopeptidase [Brevundimonas sp. NIBR11]|uniref:M13 family metallopeptidase n=1 Tax=Brevundimonas sp. NIBR11 TaxID=3015999 RepID=UPI0022F0E477|nr:M13 family metallopeptidase [Brevundimonas sp. NIBR11]